MRLIQFGQDSQVTAIRILLRLTRKYTGTVLGRVFYSVNFCWVITINGDLSHASGYPEVT